MAYYYLQRVMMDKAQRFTDVARHVVMSDPLLDENQRRPIATFAANEANYQAGIASEQALAAIAKQAGLLFFFRSDCRYCHIQAPLLALLEKRFGFKVYAVSLDGQAMPNGLYPDFHNMNQFVDLMRAVASNAAGYAFQLAIYAMCPDCGNVMSDLQKKVQQLNQMFFNSCQLAQGLVNDAASVLPDKVQSDMKMSTISPSATRRFWLRY